MNQSDTRTFLIFLMIITIVARSINKGSYMSAHVLLNLLNELEKKIRCDALQSILLVFPNESNKFNNTGARMQDSIYHMTLKSHFIMRRFVDANT